MYFSKKILKNLKKEWTKVDKKCYHMDKGGKAIEKIHRRYL